MRLLAPVLDSYAMEIPADLERLREAREWAATVAQEAGFRNGDCYQIRLAMSEAVANAIQHGSQGPSDVIRLAVCERDGLLVFEVRDNGTFIPPPAPPTDDDERGRGLELLALMMDEVGISSDEGGSRLRFAKRIESRAA